MKMKQTVHSVNPRYKKYDEHKDSGVEWLGEIPKEWSVIKLKYLVEIIKRIANESDLTVLSITQNGIKIKDIKSGEGQLAMDYSKYQLVYKDDFAMNHMDLLTGYVDISKYDGVTSPDYRVFRIMSNDIYPKFLLTLFQLCYNQKIFYAHGQGVSQFGRWRFPADNFKNFLTPLPSPQEQKAIAEFLDKKCEQIDKAISLKERQIELLIEYKQIIIQNAVTKGLDPTVKMKDSGIDYIGEIPEHWEVKRFQFLANITTGDKNTEDKISDGNFPFYVRSQTPEKINTYSYDGEAILTAGDGAGVGKVYHYVNEKFDFHQRVYMFNDFKEASGKFLFNYLSALFYNVAILGTAKSTVDSLRLPLIQNFLICFPKNYDQQQEIITYIDDKSSIIDKTISFQNQQIEKLREYKTTLIDSAVTGKIKVIKG